MLRLLLCKNPKYVVLLSTAEMIDQKNIITLAGTSATPQHQGK